MRSAEHLRRKAPRGDRAGRKPYAGWRAFARTLQLVLLLAFVGGIALVGVAVGTGAWQIRPVLSGSMQPGLTIGGVAVVERVPVSSLAVRDVVVFHPPDDPDVTYVHRIVSLQRSGGVTTIHTKGDDNPVADPWTVTLKGGSIYEARFSLPLLGYAAVWIRSPSGRRDLLLAAGALAAVGAISLGLEASRKGRRARQDGGPAFPEPPAGGPAAPAGHLELPAGQVALPELPSAGEVSWTLETARTLEASRALEVARALQLVHAFGIVQALGAARSPEAGRRAAEVTVGAGPGEEANPSVSPNPPVGAATSTGGWVDDRVGYERMI